MGESMPSQAPRRKPPITVSLDPSLVEWLDANTGLGKAFRGRTDAIEKALLLLKQTYETQSREARIHHR